MTLAKEYGKIASRQKHMFWNGEDHEEFQLQIRVKMPEGMFYAELPDILKGAPRELTHDRNIDHRGFISGKTLDALIANFKTLAREHEVWSKDQVAEKVIAINYKRNVRPLPKFHANLRRPAYEIDRTSKISFERAPAMALHFEVVYRIKDELFRRRDDGRTFHRCHPDHTHLVKWTEEREAFLQATVEKFENMIGLCDLFFDDLDTNMTVAIEAQSRNMLEAPSVAMDAAPEEHVNSIAEHRKAEARDDLDKLDGTGKYRGDMGNICYADGIFANSLTTKYGFETLGELRAWATGETDHLGEESFQRYAADVEGRQGDGFA